MSNDSSEQSGAIGTAHRLLVVLQTVFAGLALYLVPPVIASLLLGLAIGISGMSSGEAESWIETTYAQFAYILLTELFVIGLLVLLLRKLHQTWQQIGVRWPKSGDIGYMLAGFAVYFVVYLFVAQLLQNHLDFEQRQELGFDTGVSGLQLGLVFVSLVLLPPLVEEILFRGFLYTQLKRVLSVIWAAAVVSVLFAVAHLQFGSGNALLWVAAVDTFILSLVLVYLREKTGSIWAGVGVHALKNCIAFLILFVFHLG